MSIELLDTSISFSKSLINIEENIINIVNHARKSLLFDDSDALVKKKIGTHYSMSQWAALTAQRCVNLLDFTF